MQISLNVNKRIGMCENLILFCLSCKKDICSLLTSPQVEKEKKKGMIGINLRSVAVVPSLGGGLASLKMNTGGYKGRLHWSCVHVYIGHCIT